MSTTPQTELIHAMCLCCFRGNRRISPEDKYIFETVKASKVEILEAVRRLEEYAKISMRYFIVISDVYPGTKAFGTN